MSIGMDGATRACGRMEKGMEKGRELIRMDPFRMASGKIINY